MGKEGYSSAQAIMAQGSKRDMQIAISHIQGLSHALETLGGETWGEKMLNFRKRRAVLIAFKTAGEDIDRIAFTQGLVENLNNLQYFKGCYRNQETTHIKGIVDGCRVDILRTQDRGADSVRGRVGRIDVSQKPQLAYSIFDTYGPLLEEREKLARILSH